VGYSMLNYYQSPLLLEKNTLLPQRPLAEYAMSILLAINHHYIVLYMIGCV